MKILIAGYYGFGNLGDELILSCVLDQLRGRYKSPDICVLSADPAETKKNHHVRSISRWNPFLFLREMWNADFVIVGGGGLLQNKTSQRSLLYYLSIVGLARLFKTPVMLYALGVEFLAGRTSKRLVGWLLNSPLVKITVRDQTSAQVLSGLGIPEEKINVTADPVFARSATVPTRERYSFDSPSVLLIPRFPCPPSGRRLFAVLGRILKDQRKMNVKGVLFQPKSEFPFLTHFNGESILTEQDFINDLSTEDLAKQVGNYDWVVSARFHGLVLAALAGRPFIGIGDEHKVGRLCASMGMPYLPWDAQEEHIQAALHLLSQKSAESMHAFVQRLRQSALRTSEFVG